MKRFFVAMTAAILATAAPAFAADTSSVPLYDLTNRPITTIAPSAASTYTVAPNTILLEAGFTNTSSTDFPTASAYPQAMVHIGTQLKGLEVDVQAPSEYHNKNTSFSSDIAAGAKYMVLNAKRYAVSAQVGIDLPTGSQASQFQGTQTNYGLNGTYKISPVFQIRTTQDFNSHNVAGLKYGNYNPSFVVLAALPSENQVFAAYAVNTHDLGPGTASRSSYLIGASHQLKSNLSIDVEGTTSPSANGLAKANSIGAGAAYKF